MNIFLLIKKKTKTKPKTIIKQMKEAKISPNPIKSVEKSG